MQELQRMKTKFLKYLGFQSGKLSNNLLWLRWRSGQTTRLSPLRPRVRFLGGASQCDWNKVLV